MASVLVKGHFKSTGTSGAPKTGMTGVTVSIVRDSDTTQVVTDAAASEIGLGFYGYTFSAYDPDETYSVLFNSNEAGVVDQYPPGQISDDVGCAEIHTGYSLRRVLRIIGSAVAGKASNGPGSSIFRNLPDDADMITSTSDEDGDRLTITYGT